MSALRQVDSFGSILKTYASGVGYSVAGQVTGFTVGNGLVEQYTYSADRLQLTNQKVLSGATALMDFTYNYTGAAGDHGAGTTAGNAGQLVSMTGTLNGASRDQTFRYDDLGRLATATGSDVSGPWQRRFVYDRWGNRTQVWNATVGGTQTQQVNLALIGSAPSNRVSSYWDTAATGGATKTVSYDAAGNTTNDGTYSFTYDAENRIVQVIAVATGALVATYVYDSAHRRIKKTVGATTTCFVWEGAQVIAEYNNAAAPSSPNTEYIFTGGRMLAEERTGSGTTRFFHQDRLSTRLTTNSAGAVLGTQSHLPFGEQLTESSEQQKWKFTTYERDSETGDDYAINRGYWPTLARFRQADKLAGGITDPQSLNRYAYVLNDPPNLSDPSGNAPGPSLFGSYFLDASLRQYGLFIDGFEVQPGQAGLFFGLLSSGAGVIGPIGASAFLGSGGVTYLSFNTGRGYLPNGTFHLGVTLVQVQDGISIFNRNLFTRQGLLDAADRLLAEVGGRRGLSSVFKIIRNQDCFNAVLALVSVDLDNILGTVKAGLELSTTLLTAVAAVADRRAVVDIQLGQIQRAASNLVNNAVTASVLLAANVIVMKGFSAATNLLYKTAQNAAGLATTASQLSEKEQAVKDKCR